MNILRARLRSRPGSPISDDEPLPTTQTLPTIDFPSESDYAEFFMEMAGDEDSDDGDEDAE